MGLHLWNVSLECFLTYTASSYGKVYLGDNHCCNIEGMGTINLALNNGYH